MENERYLPPIASPHGGESRAQSLVPVEELELVVPVHLSFESALRCACIELIHPGKHAMIAFPTFCLISMTPIFISAGIGILRQLVLSFGIWSVYGLAVICVLCGGLVIASIYAGWQLIYLPRFEVEVQKDGIHIYYLDRDLYYLDRKFILHWNSIGQITYLDGNVWITSTVKYFLIPRESFASPIQAQAFATSLHQIWRDKVQLEKQLRPDKSDL